MITESFYSFATRKIEIVALALINARRRHFGQESIGWNHPNLSASDKEFWLEQAVAAIDAWEHP